MNWFLRSQFGSQIITLCEAFNPGICIRKPIEKALGQSQVFLLY